MTRRQPGFLREFLGLIVLCAVPCACGAQETPLEVLRVWLGYTEEAAKFVQNGNYARAEERLNLAIKQIRPYYPATQRIMARSYSELARVLYHQKRYAEAEPLAKWALEVRDADSKSSPDSVFQCVYTLGLIEAALKHHRESEPHLKRALALQEKNLGSDHVNCILILIQLASVYVHEDKYADAERLYLRAIAVHERTTPDENLDLANTAEQYAQLLRRMKRDDESERWHARAAAIRDTVATKAAKAKADRSRKEFQGFR
jgi:tetratricopeptide (TPR) repeat protein